jgi:hypothetical protein
VENSVNSAENSVSRGIPKSHLRKHPSKREREPNNYEVAGTVRSSSVADPDPDVEDRIEK